MIGRVRTLVAKLFGARTIATVTPADGDVLAFDASTGAVAFADPAGAGIAELGTVDITPDTDVPCLRFLRDVFVFTGGIVDARESGYLALPRKVALGGKGDDFPAMRGEQEPNPARAPYVAFHSGAGSFLAHVYARSFECYTGGLDDPSGAAKFQFGIFDDLGGGTEVRMASDVPILWTSGLDLNQSPADLGIVRNGVAEVLVKNPSGAPDNTASLLVSELGITDNSHARVGGFASYSEGGNTYMVVALNPAGTVLVTSGPGSPEGVLTADKGSLCTDWNTGALYRKTTNGVNTGWVTP